MEALLEVRLAVEVVEVVPPNMEYLEAGTTGGRIGAIGAGPRGRPVDGRLAPLD